MVSCLQHLSPPSSGVLHVAAELWQTGLAHNHHWHQLCYRSRRCGSNTVCHLLRHIPVPHFQECHPTEHEAIQRPMPALLLLCLRYAGKHGARPFRNVAVLPPAHPLDCGGEAQEEIGSQHVADHRAVYLHGWRVAQQQPEGISCRPGDAKEALLQAPLPALCRHSACVPHLVVCPMGILHVGGTEIQGEAGAEDAPAAKAHRDYQGAGGRLAENDR